MSTHAYAAETLSQRSPSEVHQLTQHPPRSAAAFQQLCGLAQSTTAQAHKDEAIRRREPHRASLSTAREAQSMRSIGSEQRLLTLHSLVMCAPLTLGEGRRRIYRARGLFLRCFDAPPARHSARLAARARDSGHFGAWRRAEPVAICLPPAAYPDPRPRPFPRQPADPPHRDTALMQARTHTQRLPFTGGRGRSAAGHLHSHITPHAKLPDMGYRISNEFVLTL